MPLRSAGNGGRASSRAISDPDEVIRPPAGGVPGLRRGPGRGAGHGAAPPPGDRHRARSGAEGDGVPGAGQGLPVLRGDSLRELPAGMRVRASYGPEVSAQAARTWSAAIQERASQMAALLIDAHDAATAARAGGRTALDAAVLDGLVTRYRALAALRRTGPGAPGVARPALPLAATMGSCGYFQEVRCHDQGRTCSVHH
jgi:hypothetical protein